MAVYKVVNSDSSLRSVEFSPLAEGNFSFFHVADASRSEEVKKWLTSGDMGQEIIAQTEVNGHPVFVTHGDKTKEDLIKALGDHGDSLQLEVHKKPFNFWALRGGMSVVGQSMQLASALLGVEQLTQKSAKLNPANAHFNPKFKDGMYVRKAFAADIGMFAILNLIANGANIAYGGQKESGENRLRHIKGKLNESLDDHLLPGEKSLSVDDKRAELREEAKSPPSTMEKFNDFARENSVRFFEIGLRFIGATALVIPFKKSSLSAGMTHLSKGAIVEAWNAVKNPVALTRMSGLGYLAGKTIALFTKVPDPYEDKPHTTLDTIREEYLFKLGGLIESAAGAGIMYNAFKTKKIGFSSPNKPDITPRTDWLGTVGGGLFAAGYIVRMGAKFGERHVDMNEVYAHATDSLAKTTPDKLPQLLADSAASVKEHFHDKPIEYSDIFTRMMGDLYQYHHIALDNLGTKPEERAAVSADQTIVQAEDAAQGKFTAANPPRRATERVSPPAASFSDKVAQATDTPSASLGVGA